MRAIGGWIVFMALIAAFIPEEARGEDPAPDSQWRGTITFVYRKAGSVQGSGEVNQTKHTHKHHTSQTFTTNVRACGKGSSLKGSIKNAQVDYMDSDTATSLEEKRTCFEDLTVKKPGNKKSTTSNFYGEVSEEFLKRRFSVGLTAAPSEKRYFLRLDLSGYQAFLILGKIQSEDYYPCDGDTYRKTVHYSKAVKAGEEKNDCDGSGQNCTGSVPAIPAALPLIVSHKGPYDGKRIKGSIALTPEQLGKVMETQHREMLQDLKKAMEWMPKEIVQELNDALAEMKKNDPSDPPSKPGGGTGGKNESEILQVSWDFELETPCDQVIDELKEGLSGLMAYARTETFSEAIRENWTGRQYDDKVGEWQVAIYETRWWEGGNINDAQIVPPRPGEKPRSSKIDFGTNDDCKVENPEGYQDQLRWQCYHDVIFQSIMAHENTHVRQCSDEKTQSEYLSHTPRSFNKFEIEGYCVGAATLLNWADKNCRGKEKELAPLDKAYDEYCGQVTKGLRPAWK
jgi:hypothetical protein